MYIMSSFSLKVAYQALPVGIWQKCSKIDLESN